MTEQIIDGIKHHRNKLNLTQGELATATGISLSKIKHLESGTKKTLQRDEIDNICDALAIKFETLVFSDDPYSDRAQLVKLRMENEELKKTAGTLQFVKEKVSPEQFSAIEKLVVLLTEKNMMEIQDITAFALGGKDYLNFLLDKRNKILNEEND